MQKELLLPDAKTTSQITAIWP